MEKIISKLFEVAFIALLVRSFLAGPSISDAMVLMSLVAAIIVKQYLAKGKTNSEEVFAQKIEDLTSKVNALSMKQGVSRVTINERR